MSFNELRMDDKVAFGFQAVPEYNTLIVPKDNGGEARNINWPRAKREFSAEYYKFSFALFEVLLATFHAMKGSGYSFRFKDHTDYYVVGGAHGTVTAADSAPLQLVKKYTHGAQTTTRTIKKPVAGTVTVYEDTGSGPVAKAGTTDTTTGLFTPTAPWTLDATLTADFEFDVPVRFASDRLPSRIVNVNKIVTDAQLIEDFLT